jgi:hypothetical protein
LISTLTSHFSYPCSSFFLAGSVEPNWDNPSEWKRLKVFPGRTGTSAGKSGKLCLYTAAKSNAVGDIIKQVKKACGVKSSNVLHGGRKGGARLLGEALSRHPGTNGNIN